MRNRPWAVRPPRKVIAASTVGACLLAGGLLAPMLASAAAPKPKLTITPSSIYYPCSEGNVKFSVRGFPATTAVSLRLGSTAAVALRTIDTNANGFGKATVAFSGYYQGYYTFYATGATTTVRHVLEVGVCP
jgi:hypothetical protein